MNMVELGVEPTASWVKALSQTINMNMVELGVEPTASWVKALSQTINMNMGIEYRILFFASRIQHVGSGCLCGIDCSQQSFCC